MSEFSDLFSMLVSSRDINVTGLAAYCGLDRSTMYKLLNGRRNPSSREQVLRISEFMNLNPLENRELLNAYLITRIGWDVFCRRTAVLEFILNFQNLSPSFSGFPAAPEPGAPASQPEEDRNARPLSGRLQVSAAVHSLCLEALADPKGTLDIIAQPEHLKTLDIVSSLAGGSSLRIRHILCVNNNRSLIRAQQDYNLQCLTKIIPFFGIRCRYQPYYYYDDVNSHFNNLNFMPCVFLSQKSAVLCSSSLKEGIFFSAPDMISLLQNRFNTLRKSVQPLISSFPSSLATHLRNFPETMASVKSAFSLSAEPCLMPCITADLLRKYLKGSPDSRPKLIAAVTAYISAFSKIDVKSCFTREGARAFLETGRLHEVPRELYSPLEYPDRILLLKQLRHYLSMGYEIRLLNTPLDRFPLHLHLFSSSDLGYILFEDGVNGLNYLVLKEQNLLNAFYDFSAALEKGDLLCSAEETDTFLKELIEK